MQIASARLKLDKVGSDIPLASITPAEALILRKGHEINAGGDPISHLVVIGETKTTDAEEVARLRAKYGNLRVKMENGKDLAVVQSIFPGEGNRLPQTFKELGYDTTTGAPSKPETYAPQHKGVAMDDLKPESAEPKTPAK